MERINRAKNRKFHYIYKITRFDGAYYIGMHSTDNLEDGYFGSGQRLWKSINYHGKDKHTKEILEFLPDRESLAAREKELVRRELLEDRLCMNLSLGGEGGLPRKFVNNPDEAYKFHKAGFDAMNKVKDFSAAAKKAWKTNLENNGEKALQDCARALAQATINAAKPEAIEKKKKTFAEIKHMQGEKNSQFGKRWIHSLDLKVSKRILKEEPLPNGYREGRKLKF